MPGPRRDVVPIGLVVSVALVLVFVVLGTSATQGGTATSASDAARGALSAADPTATAGSTRPRPNVVVIVADDLDGQLMPYLPHVRELIGDQGATFDRFYVEQGTCCTSRSTILTGEYAHNHQVEANAWPLGGFERFKQYREAQALPTWLQAAGYRTALMGKYLNEYPSPPGFQPEQREAAMRYVPPGWDDWLVPVQGNAYAQDHYRLNDDGAVDPDFRSEYLDAVLGRHLDQLASGEDGFDLAGGGGFLYYASYSPHTPYASPPRFADVAKGVTYPRGPSYDEADVSDKFGMTATRKPITAAYGERIDAAFRQRIRSVQVLDANVATLMATLEREGTLDDTYVMFLSDNGYTMGEHRRQIGKYNQFDETLRVPFMVRGPGIEPGTVVDDVTGNADLAPTIAAITGARAPYAVDGVDLLPLLTGETDHLDRDGYLIGRALIPTERVAPEPIDEVPEDFVPGDEISRLNDFTGVVTQRWKLVHYTFLPHEELYDLENDPYELVNLLAGDEASYAAMSPELQQTVDDLRALRERLVSCRGASCR